MSFCSPSRSRLMRPSRRCRSAGGSRGRRRAPVARRTRAGIAARRRSISWCALEAVMRAVSDCRNRVDASTRRAESGRRRRRRAVTAPPSIRNPARRRGPGPARACQPIATTRATRRDRGTPLPRAETAAAARRDWRLRSRSAGTGGGAAASPRTRLFHEQPRHWTDRVPGARRRGAPSVRSPIGPRSPPHRLLYRSSTARLSSVRRRTRWQAGAGTRRRSRARVARAGF